jgi:hypothetical protein
MKEALSNSFSKLSSNSSGSNIKNNSKQKRAKKLRRQTATIDVSYATDYYPEHQPKSSRLSDVPEPELPEDLDDLSGTISEATQSGSIETLDRLSILSDSVPELVDADCLSQFSLPLVLVSAPDRTSSILPDSEPKDSTVNTSDKTSTDNDGWREIPIRIVPSIDIVIQRSVDIQLPKTSSEQLPKLEAQSPTSAQLPQNNSQSPVELLNKSVISEKRKSVSPNVNNQADGVNSIEICVNAQDIVMLCDDNTISDIPPKPVTSYYKVSIK